MVKIITRGQRKCWEYVHVRLCHAIEKDVDQELSKWVETSRKYGLKMNVHKCKIMKVGRRRGGVRRCGRKCIGDGLEFESCKVTNKGTISFEIQWMKL